MTKSKLFRIIQADEIAYQIADGLISFSTIDLEPLNNILEKATSFSLVRRDEMLYSRFSELARWSINSDSLFLSDNGLLICLTEDMVEKYKAVA